MTETITSCEKMIEAVTELGFLPLFANDIPGFSVEEMTPREYWFSEEREGPWEWKGPAARSKKCVYGKFFGKKAGFVSRRWLPDFANYRRDGYDFDARYNDGLASYKDQYVYDTVVAHGSVLSPELKDLCAYREGEHIGFETVISRLQMQTYLVIGDFEYQIDRNGNPYGWGLARYTTPEALLGEKAVTKGYARTPEESAGRILRHLRKILPEAEEEDLRRLLG
jgi:hypothetical protein